MQKKRYRTRVEIIEETRRKHPNLWDDISMMIPLIADVAIIAREKVWETPPETENV